MILWLQSTWGKSIDKFLSKFIVSNSILMVQSVQLLPSIQWKSCWKWTSSINRQLFACLLVRKRTYSSQFGCFSKWRTCFASVASLARSHTGSSTQFGHLLSETKKFAQRFSTLGKSSTQPSTRIHFEGGCQCSVWTTTDHGQPADSNRIFETRPTIFSVCGIFRFRMW